MAFGTIYDHSKAYMNKEDSSGRTAMMACARAGSIENAKKLIDLKCQHDINYVSKYGESAIFYALRQDNWNFLNEIAQHLGTEKKIQISSEDIASIKLLKNRAIAADVPFFEKLFETDIEFPEEEILAMAIKYNHPWFMLNWRDIRKTAVLHYACYYGRPLLVRALLERPDFSKINALQEGRTALHICRIFK
jgi:ankyrin repeat protein